MSVDFLNMLQNMAPRSDRTLEDLKNSNDQLAGMDAMELRGWASQDPIVPSRDLTDPLGQAIFRIFEGDFDALPTYINTRIAALDGDGTAVAQELSAQRWGPTKTPIYTVLLTFLFRMPNQKEKLLDLARYLAFDVRVPVSGTDVTGSAALHWAISTSPYVEPHFAQILFDAGASVNTKNRFGCTAASEIAQLDVRAPADTIATNNVAMLRWWIEHGGDPHAKDADGVTVAHLVDMLRDRVPALAQVLDQPRPSRPEAVCANCGRCPRADTALAVCGRCKKRRFCSEECQRIDWRGHKGRCLASTA